jgi:type II secretory pathway component PulF
MSNRDALLTPDPKAAEQVSLSREDLGIFSWAWSDLLGAGVPILEGLGICAEVFPNARLRLMIALAHQAFLEQEELSEAWSTAPAKGGVPPDFLSVVFPDAGEDSGDLDALLREYATEALKEVPQVTLAGALSRSDELVLFTAELSKRKNMDLSVAQSLKEVGELPSLISVADRIRLLTECVETGESLSEAMRVLDGSKLQVDPVYRAMINAGEVGGVLDILLQRLVQQGERISNA